MSDYDAFAQAYSSANESNLLNAWYERPAMIDLAGDVDDRRVLRPSGRLVVSVPHPAVFHRGRFSDRGRERATLVARHACRALAG